MSLSQFRRTLLIFGCLLSIAVLYSAEKAQNRLAQDGADKTVEFTSSNLPIINIDTQGKAIPNTTRIMADMGIIDNGPGNLNSVTDPFNNYSGKISIELRGSSTQQFPKKQYAVETQDSTGANLNVSLLGLPRENDWILYAPYTDKSLMRNVLIYDLSRKLGHYATRTRYCELVLNGEYRGIYTLFEKIKRDNRRVKITAMDSSDVSGNNLTGGYIIKIDKWDGENNDGWSVPFPAFTGINRQLRYQFHYPKPDEIRPEQAEYIKNYIADFENAMQQSSYADAESGYYKYIDVASFVDYLLLNEISKNVDAYRLSAFFYKDRDSKNGKMFAGPIWDYNLAFGNANYYTAGNTQGWILEYFTDAQFQYMDGSLAPFWWLRLWQDPNFKNHVYKRWWELRRTWFDVDYLMTEIDCIADTLDEARKRNFEQWPVLGTYVWPNNFVGNTYEEELDYLKNWIQDRIQWIDDNIQQIGTPVADTDISETSFVLAQNYPNPFNSHTVISWEIPNPMMVQLTVYNILGEKVRTLVDGEQSAGTLRTAWDGRDDRGQTVPTGLYAYQLKTVHMTCTRKMLSIQ